MKKAISIKGYNKENREINDFYPTPKWCSEALMKREKFEGLVWECACGNGSMSKVIEKYNEVVSTDLIDRGYGLFGEVNFLDLPKDKFQNKIFENIITNPPYILSEEFINQAKKKANRKIAMFFQSSILHAEKRYNLFQDKEFPLSKIYIFSCRPTIFPNGIVTSKNKGTKEYVWLIWDKEHVGKPIIEWIKDNPRKRFVNVLSHETEDKDDNN